MNADAAPRARRREWIGLAVIALPCLGRAPVFVLGTDMIVGTAPPERAEAASAISETGNELGGALGIAVTGSTTAEEVLGSPLRRQDGRDSGKGES